MPRIVRIWIDEQVCLAHGLCVSECPEVFSLEDTISFAKVLPDGEKFYHAKDAEIRSAVNCCPVECIHIEESDG
jgi:ferredoxin